MADVCTVLQTHTQQSSSGLHTIIITILVRDLRVGLRDLELLAKDANTGLSGSRTKASNVLQESVPPS